jgi:hypothetical protein
LTPARRFGFAGALRFAATTLRRPATLGFARAAPRGAAVFFRVTLRFGRAATLPLV